MSLVSRISLHLRAEGLTDADTFSKSDPFAVLYIKEANARDWDEIGRTEVVNDTLDPAWTEHFVLSYRFETVQELRIDIYDADSASPRLEDHDFLGRACTSLARLMGRGGWEAYPLTTQEGARTKGSLVLVGEEVANCNDILHVRFSARGLDKMDWFGKSDPFLRIHRTHEEHGAVAVWESPVIKKTLNPDWDEAHLSVQSLCNADINRPMRIECWDWNRSGSHDYIGSCSLSVATLIECVGETIPLVNEKKKAKKGRRYTDSGHLVVASCRVERRFSMLDYIQGGCELNLIVGIDFTASNGAVSLPSSLHHRSPMGMNEYEAAISSVGAILQHYDSDQQYPVYGFGGRLSGARVTDHCLPLTFDPSTHYVEGVDGILAAYRNALDIVSLSGPTCFAPLVRRAADEARAVAPDTYTVLLIITDGEITDFQATVREIISASTLALSIIIVGVGNASFASMNELDADDAPLQFGSQRAARDIVQFVPFRPYAADPSGLAREVLAEIPGQFLSYMAANRVEPKPPRARDDGAAAAGMDPSVVASSRAGPGAGGTYGASSQPARVLVARESTRNLNDRQRNMRTFKQSHRALARSAAPGSSRTLGAGNAKEYVGARVPSAGAGAGAAYPPSAYAGATAPASHHR